LNEPDPITPIAEEPVRAARPGWFVGWFVAGLLALAAAVVALGPGAGAVWETIRANLDVWQAWADRNPLAALLAFFAAYAVFASLPMPVLTVMSLLAGCLFGRWLGTGVASLAYTAGVTAAFLAVRWAGRAALRARFGGRLGAVERGLRRDGAYYLLALRLMPAIPFFLINWLMALTPIRTRTFSLISWVGVLPMTFLYASVGTELGAMESPADVLSLPLLLSLVALAVAPLLIRHAIRYYFPLKGEDAG
jgi:uncharacterized membrane protein YdjX (TVP38/TMEM64 family)